MYKTTFFPERAGEIEPEIFNDLSFAVALEFSKDRVIDIEEGLKGLLILDETGAGAGSSGF
jgi:hypothetical protein